MEDIQANNQKFTYNENCRVRLKENLLEIDTDIAKEEFAQLYNLIVYTHENIKNYSYHVLNDKIHIEITYDLTDENPELWLKFIKSYNLYMD
ncbi:MAG: hypothetical protein BZ137_00965 [Methanosphaera sp. rholeuAM130]|nr:MAG: hypothetical protein BZ137_00965 [Methanosphaera sp. rholeuAM130]